MLLYFHTSYAIFLTHSFLLIFNYNRVCLYRINPLKRIKECLIQAEVFIFIVGQGHSTFRWLYKQNEFIFKASRNAVTHNNKHILYIVHIICEKLNFIFK